jgi:phage-related baseplate assembly protein
MNTIELLNELSVWIDEYNQSKDPEALLWSRVAKVSEEAGEAIAALIGATGQNPRKGRTHMLSDVESELLDVAITALGAICHIRRNDDPQAVMLAFEAHVRKTHARAGLAVRRDSLR